MTPQVPPGAELPQHPDFLWRNPEPQRHYSVVLIGGGGHGLATAHYLARRGITDVAVLEKGWLAGGNMARNTTIIRSNYLWDASAGIYEHSLKLWETPRRRISTTRSCSPSAACSIWTIRCTDIRDSRRRVAANRLNGVDAEWVDAKGAKEICPILNISGRHPVPGAGWHLSAAGRNRQARLRRLGFRPLGRMRPAST